MRSIRLSLLVCFLGLLTLALGAASLFAYRTSEQTLLAKKAATQKLLEAQYKERCREEERHLNEHLLDRAQMLDSLAQFTNDDELYRYGQFHWLGFLTTGFVPNGGLLIPVWVAEGTRTPISLELSSRLHVFRWRNYIPLRFKDTDQFDPLDGQPGVFFQVDTDWGLRYPSRSLEGRTLPDPTMFAPDHMVHHEYADWELRPGCDVRRIVFKTPLSRFFPGRPDTRRQRPMQDPGSAAIPPELPRSHVVYIQYAVDLSRFRAEIAGLAARRDAELADLEAQSQVTLTALRNRLLTIGTLTLLAAAVGSIWIVRHGLAPLRKLSDAVSHISPKRLQLPFDQQTLPAELSPIVERLTATLEQLRRAFEREKQATADISHELRTPLAALLTTTEIALRKPRTPDEYRELLGDCRLSAQQMNQTIERLLTLARLDAGVDHLRPQTVDAAVLAEQCAALVRPLAEARNLQLHVHRNGAASLMTDPDKLREVVTNLLHNAVQYNRPAGSIDLSIALAGERLQVEVRDTGIGIGAEARERIFERFYRADPSRGTDGLHCGLGLAIVKEYVDLMGGSIAVESTLGEGSIFRISLPVTRRAA